MEMMRPARYLLCTVGLAAALAGCTKKPTEEACDKAIVNIRRLTGQSNSEVGADRRAAVRSCRAQSSSDTVECYVEAQTVEELFGCGGEMAAAVREMEKKMGAGPGAGAAPADKAGAGAAPADKTGAGAAPADKAGAPPADEAGAGAASGEGSGSGW
jgi:hypothetical protein